MDSCKTALKDQDLSIVKMENIEETDEDICALPFETVEIKVEHVNDYDDADSNNIRHNENDAENKLASTVSENLSIELPAKGEPDKCKSGSKNKPSASDQLFISKLEPIVELDVGDKALTNLEEELNTFNCHHCDLTFKNKMSLREHIRNTAVHAEEKMIPNQIITCEVCQKVLKTENNLKVHMLQMHSDGNLSVSCSVCDKVFKTDILLQRHTKCHGSVFKCLICDRTLSSFACYRIHMKNVHGNAELKICDLCGKGFKRKPNLARHIQYVHGDMKPLAKRYLKGEIQCSNCPKRFETRGAMRWHFERTHADKTNVSNNRTCHICYKEMCDLKSLRRHFEQVHPIESATCTVCMKVFKSHRNLQRHMKVTHARPEKAKNCSICKKEFKCKAHLAIHINLVHKRGGPVECDMCGKEFLTRIYMEKHKKLHDVSTAVPCNICGKVFRSLIHAKKHERSVHRNKDQNKVSETGADNDNLKKHSDTMICDSIIPLSMVQVEIGEMSE